MNIHFDYAVVIFGSHLQKLWTFCLDKVDKVAFTNSRNPYYTKEEHIIAKKELELDRINRENNIFHEMLLKANQTDKDNLDPKGSVFSDEISFMDQNIKFVMQSDINNRLQVIKEKYKLINRKATCITPCTNSFGVVELFTFELNDNLKQCLYNMEDLFSYINFCDDITLEDLTFYRGEEVLLSICSHEQFANLTLSEDEYNDFLKLEIPHLPENIWWEEEYFNHFYKDGDKIPFINHRATISTIEGYSYIIDIMDMTNYIEREEIFQRNKNKVPPNKIPLEQVLRKLKETYSLVVYESSQLVEQTKANILINNCLARYLPISREINIELFMIIEDDKSKNLYDLQEKEHEYREMKFKNIQYNYQPKSFKREPIIIGVEYNCGYLWVNGSDQLREEITLLRGLDEFELRDQDLLCNYVNIAEKNGLHMSGEM